jgi:UDP:flavonoid glycosyltransferase YjiC (YdhE family)
MSNPWAPLVALKVEVDTRVDPGAAASDASLVVPANAAVYVFVLHSAVLAHAKMTVDHARHGSVMAALADDVPLVCMPSRAAGQPVIAARVRALGAGKSIAGEPTGATAA